MLISYAKQYPTKSKSQAILKRSFLRAIGAMKSRWILACCDAWRDMDTSLWPLFGDATAQQQLIFYLTTSILGD